MEENTLAAPTLSVVMPNYNHAAYVRTALSAVLQQSHRPQEVIVVDDGSEDNSVEVVQEIAKADPLVRLVQNDRNRGVAYTHNRGLSIACGDYVYFAGADDQVVPGFFERAMEMAAAHPDAGIIFGKVAKLDADGNLVGIFGVSGWNESRFARPEAFLRELLEVECPTHSLCGATIYWRKCLLEVGGFRSSLEHWADTFAARAIGLRYGGCYVPEVFMRWRYSGSSVAHSTSTSRAIRIATAAARLMRSPEFCDRFPEPYVQKWLQDYYDIVIARHVVQTERQIQAENRQRRDRIIMPLHRLKSRVAKALPVVNYVKFGRLIDPVIRLIGESWCALRIRLTERSLRKHQGPL